MNAESHDKQTTNLIQLKVITIFSNSINNSLEIFIFSFLLAIVNLVTTLISSTSTTGQRFRLCSSDKHHFHQQNRLLLFNNNWRNFLIFFNF
jgi:hypothetical protein